MARLLLPIALAVLVIALPVRAEEEAEEPKPGWLGVSIAAGEEEGESRLVIENVVDDSPAAKAGVEVGDVLLAMAGKEIGSVDALREILTAHHAGDALSMKVMRGEETIELEVTLGARPEPPPRGITGKKAPAWKVDKWSGLPEGVKALDVKDLKGKVVYLYCFQSWCPGCHKHGFPTLQAVRKHYAEESNIAFVVMQTVFEGFRSNTFERGQETLKKFEQQDLPFAMSGSPEKRSEIMKAYNTGGTPWTVVIDPEGIVRFDGFSIEPEKAIELIDGLLPKEE